MVHNRRIIGDESLIHIVLELSFRLNLRTIRHIIPSCSRTIALRVSSWVCTHQSWPIALSKIGCFTWLSFSTLRLFHDKISLIDNQLVKLLVSLIDFWGEVLQHRQGRQGIFNTDEILISLLASLYTKRPGYLIQFHVLPLSFSYVQAVLLSKLNQLPLILTQVKSCHELGYSQNFDYLKYV